MLLSFRCYNLNYLNLRNCEHLTDLGVEFIANIFSLVSVDLSGTHISNEVKKKKRLLLFSVTQSFLFCKQWREQQLFVS